MHRSTFKRKIDYLLDKEKHHMFYDVLKKAILTEKTGKMELENNIIAFFIPKWANKTFIKHAVKKIFNVEVKSIRTVSVTGKLKRSKMKDRREYMESPERKVYITVDSVKKISEALK